MKQALQKTLARFVGRAEANDGEVRFLGRGNDVPISRRQLRRDILHIQFGLARQWQHRGRFAILEQHDGFALRQFTGCHKLRLANYFLGGSNIHIRVIEQPQHELLAQQAPGRFINATFAHLPAAHQLNNHFGAALATKLIHARLNRLLRPLTHAEMLHAPTLGLNHDFVTGLHVSQQAPIGADDAIEAILAAQQTGDDLLVKPKAHFLKFGADGHAVIGHDLRCARRKRGIKWNQVIVEVVARVNLLFADCEVRIFAIFLRAAAGEMLGHAGHAVRAELLALKAKNIRVKHARRERGILAKGAADARPTWLCRQIGHRMQRYANAYRQIFLAGDVGKVLHQIRVANRGQPNRLRPLREFSDRDICADVVAKGMARVG